MGHPVGLPMAEGFTGLAPFGLQLYTPDPLFTVTKGPSPSRGAAPVSLPGIVIEEGTRIIEIGAGDFGDLPRGDGGSDPSRGGDPPKDGKGGILPAIPDTGSNSGESGDGEPPNLRPPSNPLIPVPIAFFDASM